MAEANNKPVLALVRDLMFVGRISATARASGVPIKVIRDPAALSGEAGRLLLVDLNLAGAIEAAAAWKSASGGEAIGFVSHVDAETIQRARESGIDQVMPRSRFVEALAGILS